MKTRRVRRAVGVGILCAAALWGVNPAGLADEAKKKPLDVNYAGLRARRIA